MVICPQGSIAQLLLDQYYNNSSIIKCLIYYRQNTMYRFYCLFTLLLLFHSTFSNNNCNQAYTVLLQSSHLSDLYVCNLQLKQLCYSSYNRRIQFHRSKKQNVLPAANYQVTMFIIEIKQVTPACLKKFMLWMIKNMMIYFAKW